MVEESLGLTEEELDAIAESSSDSVDAPINARSQDTQVVAHDLASEDSSLGFNQGAIDLVNERFARQLRMGLIDVLRTTPKISPEKIEIKTFKKSIENMAAPLSINTVKMDPLRGMSLIVIEPKIIFSALDSFFGGFGKGLDNITPTRIFTPTEASIIDLVMNIVFAALKDAWSPIMQVNFQRVSSEVNPQFAQIADDDELMLVSKFNFSLANDVEGYLQIIQPFSLLKPARDLLRSRVQTSDEQDEQSSAWERNLGDATLDVPLLLRAKIAELSMSYGQLTNLREGQMLPIELFDEASVSIDDIEIFKAITGEVGGKVALQIQSMSSLGKGQ
jgi:flagellar motor switch protein FliM